MLYTKHNELTELLIREINNINFYILIKLKGWEHFLTHSEPLNSI